MSKVNPNMYQLNKKIEQESTSDILNYLESDDFKKNENIKENKRGVEKILEKNKNNNSEINEVKKGENKKDDKSKDIIDNLGDNMFAFINENFSVNDLCENEINKFFINNDLNEKNINSGDNKEKNTIINTDLLDQIAISLKKCDEKLTYKYKQCNALIEDSHIEIDKNKDIYKQNLDHITNFFNNYENGLNTLNDEYSKNLYHIQNLSTTLLDFDNYTKNLDFTLEVIDNYEKMNSKADTLPDIFSSEISSTNFDLMKAVELYEAFKVINENIKQSIFKKNFALLEIKINECVKKNIKEYYENNDTDSLEQLLSLIERSNSEFLMEIYCEYILFGRSNISSKYKTIFNIDMININDKTIDSIKISLREYNEELLKECISQFGKISSKVFLVFPESKQKLVIPFFCNKVFKMMSTIRDFLIKDNLEIVKQIERPEEIKKSIINLDKLNDTEYYKKFYLELLEVLYHNSKELIEMFKPIFEFLNSVNSPIKIELGLLHKLEHETSFFLRSLEGIYMNKETEYYEKIKNSMTEGKIKEIYKIKSDYNKKLKSLDQNSKDLLDQQLNILVDFQTHILSIINGISYSFISRDSISILKRVNIILKSEKIDFAGSFISTMVESMKETEENLFAIYEFIIIEVEKFGESLQDAHYFGFSKLTFQVNEINDIFCKNLRQILIELGIYDDVEEFVSNKISYLNKKLDDVFNRIELVVTSSMKKLLNNINPKQIYNIKNSENAKGCKELAILQDNLDPLFSDVLFSWPDTFQNRACLFVIKIISDKLEELLKICTITEIGSKIMKQDFSKIFLFFDSKIDKMYTNNLHNTINLMDIFIIDRDAVEVYCKEMYFSKEKNKKFDNDLIILLKKKRLSYTY